MKKAILFLVVLFPLLVWGQSNPILIKGKVTNGVFPLSNVNIKVKTSKRGVTSDEKGNYKILVNEGDVLTYTYVGMTPVEISIENERDILNISMVENIESLDEVMVTKSVRKNQKDLAIEYRTDPDIIKSTYGYMHKDQSASYMTILDGKELNQSSLTILDAIRKKFPRLVVKNGYLNEPPSLTIPRKGAIIFDVDGVVSEDVPIWLDVKVIERMALVYGNAALRWGGGSGVLIINTKRVQNAMVEPGTNLPYDRAKLRNNIYKGDALSADGIVKMESNYIQDLHQSTNVQEVLKVYNTYKNNFGSSYHFLIDIVNSILIRFDNDKLADELLDQNKSIFFENPLALKALAFMYQSDGRLVKANELYKAVFVLSPNEVQSYMDIANSYREIGAYKKAATIFARYNYLLEEGLLKNSDSSDTIMRRDFNNLIALKGNDILSNKNFKNPILEDEFEGTRMIFEWNDSDAEFILQFVNPEGNYFNSERSTFYDVERIYNENTAGFYTEEQLIYGDLTETWQVNATYLGNKSITPSYLKATIYHNYGSISQRQEVLFFKLSLRNVNQQLFSVSSSGSLVLK